MTRRQFLVPAIAGIALTSVARAAWAASPDVFAAKGLAIGGYDPVAYFKAGRPVPGKSQFSLVWRGATWRFADADAMEAFEMNPKGYAPEYGGYCAYAMSKGAVAPTVPDAFTVYDGRLYLNYSLDVRTTWKQDIPGNVKKADAYWPEALQR
ncbi:MAG: YHS domain protein [Rhodobacteraceae bacterium]|nr:YHS domain protein [Paracoccaceae bacterium]